MTRERKHLLSRTQKKNLLPSPPSLVLDTIKDLAPNIYPDPQPIVDDEPQPHLPVPISLHTILSNHIHAMTVGVQVEAELALSTGEILHLRSRGYTTKSVERWAQCLLEESSVVAASLLRDKNELPPLFLILLFLRRKHMRSAALGVIVRHLQFRVELEDIDWSSLKMILIRLLRHARRVWPEVIPWIATFYSTEASRIYRDMNSKGRPSVKSTEVTQFSNAMLELISLPTTVDSLKNAVHQEKAQFRVLQFMDSCQPALVITRAGFRATARNQLAHPKTDQEREWAMLKGSGWPPWKENRNAMDEEKGYEFGSSRASQILHRMYEAGYAPSEWEHVLQTYAGWDTDGSPTIQWRTSFPHVSTAIRPRMLGSLRWAARVRATRTRREAWACFLAYEASECAASPEVYFAMFEKLHAPEMTHRDPSDNHTPEHPDSRLPGDTIEVLPEDPSPLHRIYLDEPVPTFEQLYHRMMTKQVPLSNRLVAFLVGTLPDFSTTLDLLVARQSEFDGGLKCLLEGSISPKDELPVPNYFFSAFIQFLCRFGRLSRAPSTTPLSLPIDSEDHHLRLQTDPHYMIEYASTLMMHYKPRYIPAWTAYVEAIQHYYRNSLKHIESHRKEDNANLRAASHVEQYRTVCNVFQTLEEIDVDPNGRLFKIFCTVARIAAHSACQGRLSQDDTRYVLSTAPRFIRIAFHDLIAADMNLNNPDQSQLKGHVTPHIPDVTVLHLYVRTLGMLRDHEGLYSLSIWMAAHHQQIEALAHTQEQSLKLFLTLVAMRAALEGKLQSGIDRECASEELVELVKAQIESVEVWWWPSAKQVDAYTQNPYGTHSLSESLFGLSTRG